MKKDDELRKRTCIVIRKDGEFLVGRICYSKELRWSIYVNDAWQTRNREAARWFAARTGGEMMLFNPIVGQMRAM